MPAKTILPGELQRLRESGEALQILDVRTPREHAEVHVEGVRLLPLGQLDPVSHLQGKSRAVYVLCRSGQRAERACAQLAGAGFEQVFNVEGGILAWEQAGLPVIRSSVKAISLERQVRIGAGSLVLLGVLLGWLVNPAGFAVSAFVGCGLVFAGVTDWCGMAMVLAKMPWNR